MKFVNPTEKPHI